VAPPAGDPTDSTAPEDGGVDYDDLARRHRAPPPPPDARVPPPPDAGGAPPGGDPTRSGVISCYTQGAPGATCSLPTQCCFSNYSSAHNGECSTAACAWGTITCDGPEDCATGQHCCGRAMIDPDWGIYGYRLACQSAACGAAPANLEICHPSAATNICGTGRSCVTASINATDLPPSLYVCR
jgi:hypothetical protein